MEKIKNIGTFIAISLLCVCIAGGSVLAGDGVYNRRGSITSKGVINYADNTVVLDSSDLIYLADEIDKLERSYKSSTMEALNRIGTFYASTDGRISHAQEDNYVSLDMAAELKFSDLYHGIVKSQSVDHLSNVQAKDADGNPLYYADQNAGENNDLIAVTKDANDYPLFIHPAGAGNLTAGTAAWVDGKLIIGTGADNTAYYNLGWADGYASNVPNGARIEYVKHYHDNSCEVTVNIWETKQYFEMHEDHYHGSGGEKYRFCLVCNLCLTHSTYGGMENHTHTSYTCGYSDGQILEAHIIYE